jgi:DNA-binding LytR/AlgR family response regulator
MITAIAIDDEPPALKVVENFSSKLPYVRLEKTFTKPGEAIRHLRKFPVDLLFLDIQMPSMTGIEFYKAIEQNTMVIFTTAYSEYAVEGFNLKAVDYLLKPYSEERFVQAVEKANEHFKIQHQAEKTESRFLFIRADYSLIKINIEDILLIEGLDDYMKIHIKDQRPIVARMTMKSILEKLPAKEFVRVHRSFIIPFSKIVSIQKKIITVSGHEIPIGTSYEESFFSLFNS